MEATVPVTIYGSSDDLIELETPDKSIFEEYDCYGTCVVKLTAPNGEHVSVYARFGMSSETDWEVGIYGNDNADWQWEESTRPDMDLDPAIILHVPIGTTAECLSNQED